MKRKLGQKNNGCLDLSSFNGNVSPVIRVIDNALALAGWPRGARRKMLNAIKNGEADRSVVDLLSDDTCANQEPTVDRNHGMRNAAEKSGHAGFAWPLGYAPR